MKKNYIETLAQLGGVLIVSAKRLDFRQHGMPPAIKIPIKMEVETLKYAAHVVQKLLNDMMEDEQLEGSRKLEKEKLKEIEATYKLAFQKKMRAKQGKFKEVYERKLRAIREESRVVMKGDLAQLKHVYDMYVKLLKNGSLEGWEEAWNEELRVKEQRYKKMLLAELKAEDVKRKELIRSNLKKVESEYREVLKRELKEKEKEYKRLVEEQFKEKREEGLGVLEEEEGCEEEEKREIKSTKKKKS